MFIRIAIHSASGLAGDGDARRWRTICKASLVLSILTMPSLIAADPEWIARGDRGMVASDSSQASQAGLSILEAGGNAVDAAIAVSFALAVTRPYSTGLGGGGFMIARFADGRVVVQDFREVAPADATPDMFVAASEQNPEALPPSEYGYRAVAVPGMVAGRCEARKRFGTLPLQRLLAPAIDLARSGFPVDKHYEKNAKGVLKEYRKHPELQKLGGYVYRTHLGSGRLPSIGDKIVQPELARLLEQIGSGGAEFFYRGPVAVAIEKSMRAHGGIMTAKDLAQYTIKYRQPIVSTYRDYTLLLMPPPSSGGVAIAETLNILEEVEYFDLLARDPGSALHYKVEAMKHAFADRARWLGDDDFVEVPVDLLTSKVYGEQVALLIEPNQTREPKAYGSMSIPDDAGTCHFCVVDKWGNMVASSETINTTFGSLMAIDEWGLILNNQMDDFVSTPGEPNTFGLIQSARNAIAPGKRPLSSMSPTIVLKKDKPYLLLGASGGPRIISSVLNVLLGLMDGGLTLEAAIRAPRPHHQWQPDMVFFDDDPPESWSKSLRDRGHILANKSRTGIVQAIVRAENGWIGASDPRKGGRPAGH